MRTEARVLAALLAWGVLTLWIDERWPWALFQVGIFALAAWRVAGGFRWSPGPAIFPLAAAALWPLAQLALGTTIYRQAGWTAALDWGTFLLVFVLAREWFGAWEARGWFLSAAALFGLAVAVMAVTAMYLCPGRVGCLVESGFPDGVMGPFVNRNQYCAWVELLLPGSLYLAAVNGRLRVLFAAAAAVMTASVVASASRAGIVLVALEIVGCGLLLAVRVPARRGLGRRAAQFAALAALAVAVAGWQGAADRWRNTGPELLRQDALQASWQMVRSSPWMGTGLGTWSRVYPRYASLDQGVFVNQAHNDWVQLAAEGGLPFFFFLFSFAALLWKPAIRSIYGIGMVALLLHALVDYPLQQRPALAAWFFCIAGMVSAWRKGEEFRQ